MCQNRVVPMMDRLDLDVERVVFGPSVVARELTEGPLELDRVRVDNALDHDLGAGGVGDAPDLALDELHRPAGHPADELELGDRLREGERGGDEHGGVEAPDGDHLPPLASVPVSRAVQTR